MVALRTVSERAFNSLGNIPRDAWLFALFASFASELSDLALWATGDKLGWPWAVPVVAILIVWLGAVYLGATGLAKRNATVSGFGRFALTFIATLLPTGLALLTVFLGKEYFSKGALLATLLVGLTCTFLLSSLLAGWPMTQSLNTAFVPPTRMLRATRGHRGSLIFLGFVMAGINKMDLLPKMSSARDWGEASAIAAGDALINVIIIGITAAVAVAAWQFAAHTDPTLAP